MALRPTDQSGADRQPEDRYAEHLLVMPSPLSGTDKGEVSGKQTLVESLKRVSLTNSNREALIENPHSRISRGALSSGGSVSGQLS